MTYSSSYSSYLESLGEPPTSIAPANSSLLIADSKFRSSPLESPTHFECKLSNALDAKEVYYRQLIWNQPLYTHNLENNLIVFDIRRPPTSLVPNPEFYTFAVFARPWYTYRSFDGNPPGSVFQTPTQDSYAAMMEYQFNNDIREDSDLAYLQTSFPFTNGTPFYQSEPFTNRPATIRFRYSSSRGFCLYAFDSLDNTRQLQLRLSKEFSSWISQGHFIHGFGRWNPTAQKYTPQDDFTEIYYSEDTPTLLPDRYINIISEELTKDRKIQSIHSTNLSNFNNEVAILPLKYTDNSQFNKNIAGEDSTTVNLRPGRTPQSFTISIQDENGKIFICSNIMSNLLSLGPGVTPYSSLPASTPWTPQSFVLSPVLGGSSAPWYMLNYLLFGSFNQNWTFPPVATFKKWTPSNYPSQLTYSYGSKSSKMQCDDLIHVFTAIGRFN